ncbi:MAG: GAF domain-containing protein [Desulfofustis sp.]|jgi:signal transduction histidine kinase|nr:GAF domain-containing protein [Desulfofustis sp.]
MNPSLDYRPLYNAFREIISVINSSIRLKDVMDLVVWKYSEVLGARGAIMRLLNIDTDELEISASYGISQAYLAKGPVSLHRTITDACRQKKVILIEDIVNDPRVQYPESAREEGYRFIIDVPLSVADNVVGIIRLFFSEIRRFSEAELDWIIAIAEQCSCALGKARLIDSYEFKYLQLATHAEKLSALGRMAAGIAHEINNPLAGILLYSSNMIKKVPPGEPIEEGLQIIIDETIRCRKIIQGLLDFSKGRDPRKEPTNINEIIDKSIKILENEFHIHRVNLRTHLASDMIDVMADGSQLEQVFVNLLINAVEAVPEGGTVEVISSVGESRTSITIEVKDNGPGIGKKERDKIFEPFFSTKSKGTGLGLAVSYGIIRNHHGEISLQSHPGKGTRFIITIPVSQDTDSGLAGISTQETP